MLVREVNNLVYAFVLWNAFSVQGKTHRETFASTAWV